MPSRRCEGRELVQALHHGQAGDAERPAPSEQVKVSAELTPREREVLALVREGLNDKAIAGALKLSANTVRNHVASINSKIGVNRRSAAVAWARDRGLA